MQFKRPEMEPCAAMVNAWLALLGRLILLPDQLVKKKWNLPLGHRTRENRRFRRRSPEYYVPLPSPNVQAPRRFSAASADSRTMAYRLLPAWVPTF